MAEITVIGGINIDIEGMPCEELIYKDSNPGRIRMSYGGVGRNITENIARLGGDVAMVSVAGDDYMGAGAVEELRSLGVDTSHISIAEGENSAMYLSILNHRNDMELAICNMDILERITPEFIDNARQLIEQSRIVALDTNLEPELLEYVVKTTKGTAKFLDPVSAAKAVRAADIIGEFDIIKPNLLEAEILSGIKIRDEKDIRKAGDAFLDKGVQKVYITLGENGVYYADRSSDGFIRPGDVEIVSATGAGDAFSAAIIMGFAGGIDTAETAKLGMAAAAFAMKSSTAVNKNICMEGIRCLANI